MTRTRSLLTLGLLVPAALAISAATAQASGETISITQNDPSAIVGRATNFSASGVLNPDDTMFGFDIFVFVKDADADPTCAADFDTESANAMHSGGNESWVSPPGGFQVGMGPSYSAPFKITFTGAGNYLLCGYVQGDFSTFAAGELRGVVSGGKPTPPPTPTPLPTPTPTPALAKPVVMVHPWVSRKRHVLTCHPGTWNNAPTSRAYRWSVKGHGATVGSGRKLKVRRPLRGRKLVCRVTAANAAGSTTVRSAAIRAR
jgi:hypothetical protein